MDVVGGTKQAWTQGIGPDGESDGSKDVREFECSLPDAIQIVQSLPIWTCKDREETCPPVIGFDRVNICRLDNGDFYSWPDSVTMTSVDDAVAWLANNWRV